MAEFDEVEGENSETGGEEGQRGEKGERRIAMLAMFGEASLWCGDVQRT